MTLKKKNVNWEILLIALGIVGILVSVFYDSVGFGKPGVGMLELSGLIIGAIITAVGLVKVLFPDPLLLLRLLAGIYVAGIFYVGLKPMPSNYSRLKVLMDTSKFNWPDVLLNTVVFIPLGYLLMLSFRNREKDQSSKILYRSIMVAGFVCFISLFLEVSQYYLIPGRQSSLFDWISNTFGTLLGIAVYLVLSTKPVLK